MTAPALHTSAPASAPSPPAQLKALTSLRFFAAFYVVIFHVFPRELLTGDGFLERTLLTFCSHGFTAVSFFFTLSGFILAYNYPLTRSVSLGKFYRARFARVYPMYLLGVLAGLPILVVHVLRAPYFRSAGLEVFLAVTVLQAWVPTYWNALNPPGWSLSVEMFLYLCFPLLSRVLSVAGKRRERDALLLALVLTAALVPSLLAIQYSSSGLTPQDESPYANFVRYCPIIALPEFAFGILLARIHAGYTLDTRWLRSLGGLALVLLTVALTTDVVPYMLLHNGALLPLYGLVILWLADARTAWRPLNHPQLLLLGEASYALYIMHMMVYQYLETVLRHANIQPRTIPLFPLHAVLAVAASVICYKFVEQPARRWLLARGRPASHRYLGSQA